jgi:hypothetical protein
LLARVANKTKKTTNPFCILALCSKDFHCQHQMQFALQVVRLVMRIGNNKLTIQYKQD